MLTTKLRALKHRFSAEWLRSNAKNIGKNIGKNISKNLNGKYSQKLLDHAKQSASDPFKTAAKRAIQKAPEATGDLNCNKIAKIITKVPKNITRK